MKTKSINEKELNELILKAQQGDKDAKNKVLEINIPLVYYVCKKYTNIIEPDDCFQIGIIGLLKAINCFKQEFGFKFSTYAVPSINGEIRNFYRSNGRVIRIPRRIHEKEKTIRSVEEEFIKSNEKEPTVAELAEKTNLKEEEIIFYIQTKNVNSINKKILNNKNEDSHYTIEDILKDENYVLFDLDKHLLKEALSHLDKQEIYIIKQRYYRNKTQQEIGNELNLSQVQISRIESRAIKKMRMFFMEDNKKCQKSLIFLKP